MEKLLVYYLFILIPIDKVRCYIVLKKNFNYSEKQYSQVLKFDFLLLGCMPDPCIYGVCVDCDDQSYKCECDPGFEGQHCEMVDGKVY